MTMIHNEELSDDKGVPGSEQPVALSAVSLPAVGDAAPIANAVLDRAASICTASHDRRRWLEKPFTLDGWNCATNGLLGLLWKGAALPVSDFAPYHDAVKTLLTDRTLLPVPLRIQVAKITEALKAWEGGDRMEPCEQCEGVGEEKCDMGHMHDCRECNGTGNGHHTLGRRPDPNGLMEIVGVGHYAHEVVVRMHEVCAVLGVTEFVLTHGAPLGLARATLAPDVLFAFMPFDPEKKNRVVYRVRAEAESPQPASGEDLQPQTDGEAGTPKTTFP